MATHRNLQTPAPTNTRWQVFTGAPCSGKTAVIRELEQRGHRVVHEVARDHIDSQLTAGRTIDEIKADALTFERTILDRKCCIEQRLPCNKLIFMDRAVPDSIAYYRLEGLDIEDPLRRSRTMRYERVYLFERLDFENDRVRQEDPRLAARIEALLVEGYTSLDYTLIRVPRMSIAQRMRFIEAQSGVK